MVALRPTRLRLARANFSQLLASQYQGGMPNNLEPTWKCDQGSRNLVDDLSLGQHALSLALIEQVIGETPTRWASC